MRQNGQATWVTPVGTTLGDSTATGTTDVRVFTATERMTVTEFGAMIGDASHVPNASFTFLAKVRPAGNSANDFVVPAFSSPFAAEGGPGGDPSNQNFDNANQLAGGIVTNTAGTSTGTTGGFGALGKNCLRAYCEVSLAKGDQFVLRVVGAGGTSTTAVFYATAYYDGKGLVESCDADSN